MSTVTEEAVGEEMVVSLVSELIFFLQVLIGRVWWCVRVMVEGGVLLRELASFYFVEDYFESLRGSEASKEGAYRLSDHTGCFIGGERKALVLDMDETLLHSHVCFNDGYDLILNARIQGRRSSLCINLRPHLDVFLRTVSRWYDVYIFTSGMREYADPLIDMIDSYNVIKGRFFRDDCLKTEAGYVKDLTDVRKNLKDVMIIDNTPNAYSMNEDNAIPIRTWLKDPFDEELLNLLPLLHALSSLNDVRSVLSLRKSNGMLASY